MPVIAEDRNAGRDWARMIAPAIGGFVIIPSDTDEVAIVTRSISFGTAGALHITGFDGVEMTIPSGALAAGIMHPIAARKVWASGTGALLIMGWY
jgi:hypothetical protein